MGTRVVTMNDILDRHVGLDLECFDRISISTLTFAKLLILR
jgi:hypothetical protein